MILFKMSQNFNYWLRLIKHNQQKLTLFAKEVTASVTWYNSYRNPAGETCGNCINNGWEEFRLSYEYNLENGEDS